MESKFHRWWLGACVAALLLASWVGGFSVAVTAVFIVIYLTGVTLIGPDEQVREPVSVEPPPTTFTAPVSVEPAPEPEPEAEAGPEVEVGPEVEAATEVAAEPVDEDDAVPYPDDVADEPVAGVEEPTPA